MNAVPRRRLPRGIAPLGIRNYALYWVAFATSKLGRSIEETGAVWLVYQLTGSPVLLGVLGLARALPSIVLSPIAGVVVDRVDQRRLLIFMQFFGLAASVALGLLVLTGAIELWHVYAQVAIQAAITSFDGAVRQAFFPRLVPRRLLPEAVTLSATAGRSAAIVGPMIGGIAIASFGEAAPFLVTAASYPILMAALALIRNVSFKPAGVPAGLRADLVEGLRHILRAPVLSGLLKLELVFGLFQVNAVIITIIAREVLDVGPEGLGGLLAAPALGAILGIAVLISVGQPQRQGRFVVICTLGYAVAVVALAVSPLYALTLLFLAATGLLDSVATVTRHSVMQLAAPPHMRGRVMANMGTVTRGTSPLAETQSGVLAGALGPRAAVLIAAAVIAAAATATAFRNLALMRFMRGEGEHEPTATELAAEAVEPLDSGVR